MSPLPLFPSLMSELHEFVLQRANELYEELQGDPSKTAIVKLDFLEQRIQRSETKPFDSTVELRRYALARSCLASI